MIKNSSITSLTQQARPEVVDAIRQASSSTGVDFSYLLQKAATESSFDSKAQAPTSSARGLYQFVDSTWLDTVDKHGAEHGLINAAAAIERDSEGNPVVADADTRQRILALRDDPQVAAFMAAEFAKENQATLENTLGRKVGNTELYLAHFLGAGGAAKFLSSMEHDPDSNAALVNPQAARANKSVFYQGGKSLTVDQVFARFAAKFDEGTPSVHATAPTPQAAPAVNFAAPMPGFAAMLPQLATVNATTPPPENGARMDATWPSLQGDMRAARIPLQPLPVLAMRILQSLSLPEESTPANTRDWLA